jgi:hypothetical protein
MPWLSSRVLRARVALTGCSLLGLCGLAGCGDDEGPKGPAVRELPAMYAAALCPEVEACLDPRSVEQVFGELGCEEWVAAQGEDGDIPALQSAIDDGRVDYDASQVEPCLEELEGIGCDFASARALTRGVCEKIFTGTVAIDGACDVDEECEGQAFCQKGTTCPGRCTALLGPGDACAADDQCEDGLSCAKLDQVCAEEGTCVAPVEEGSVCGGNVGGNCAAGLACIGADEMTGAAGTCMGADDVFVGELGEPCDLKTGVLCKSPLSCIVETFDAASGMLALVCAEGVGPGEPCKFGAPSQCPADQRCDADIVVGDVDGTCVPLPRAGEVCVMTAASPACAPGLHCDGDGRCHPLARLTHPCTCGADCASGHCELPEGDAGMPDEEMPGSCVRPMVCEL